MGRTWRGVPVLLGIAVLVASCSGTSSPTHSSPASSSSETSNPSPSVRQIDHVATTSQADARPPCRRADLRARYAGGGDGGQMFFGTVVVWNTGAHRCDVTGRAVFAATLPDGRPDPRARADGAGLAHVSVSLPGYTPAFVDGHLTPGRYLVALLAAPEFTVHGDCESANSRLRAVAPRTFTLTIGRLRFTVANHDPHGLQNRTLRGCDGHVFLVSVERSG